jgi:hypothetical protein
MRAITQGNERAKSHPEALSATIHCVKKQKAPRKAMLFKVAPRPGLEPGTYGINRKQLVQTMLVLCRLQAIKL